MAKVGDWVAEQWQDSQDLSRFGELVMDVSMSDHAEPSPSPDQESDSWDATDDAIVCWSFVPSLAGAMGDERLDG
jgi:hypothetical protein